MSKDKQINNLQGQQADVQTEIKRIDLRLMILHKNIKEKTTKLEETKPKLPSLRKKSK